MTDTTDDPRQQTESLRLFAQHLREQLAALSKQIRVNLARLDGSTVSESLADAPERARVDVEEMRQGALEILLETKLKEHDQQALAKSRAEPETFSEWWTAVATGRLALATISVAGAAASCLVQIALIGGVIGLSAHAVGTMGLIDRAKRLELTLLENADETELAQTLSTSQSAPIDCSRSISACADEATTTARLRSVFRSAAARALEREIAARSGTRLATLRRGAFRVGAVDARRAILARSERAAAPSLDPGMESGHFQSTADAHLLERTGKPDPLDEAFARRVKTLHAHEATWNRIRAWAAHPVSPDYAAEAFLRTAMGDLHGPLLHSLDLWSERTSAAFARDLIRTGDPDVSAHALATHRRHAVLPEATMRDDRLFRDYSAEVPDRTRMQMARYDAGLEDPGSLRLVRASGPEAAGSRDLYGHLFPATANGGEGVPLANLPDRAGEGLGGGGGGSMGGSGGHWERGSVGTRTPRAPTRIAARSFARIRFSARVGGVVFGRAPEPGGMAPDVAAVRWHLPRDDQILLTIEMRDGSRINLGPYHPAIVHEALAYVADGRVVVSTLPQPRHTDGEPNIPARRVLVHPAMEDTAFACDVIQIDRFVDTFTHSERGEPPSPDLQRIGAVRSGVTNLGFLLLDEARTERSAAESAQAAEAVYTYARTCSEDDRCFPVPAYAGMGLDFGAAMRFVDCLRSLPDASGVGECLKLLQGEAPRNAYMVDSGVRELPYRIDPELKFVSGAGHQSDALWPMDFIIQAVPLHSDESELDFDAGDRSGPWQFPTIADDLRAVVARGISDDPGAKEIFRNVREFVALQRFFRTAMDGSLGTSFPLEDLVRLSAKTRQYVRVRRNERWNMNRPLMIFLGKVTDAVRRELQTAQLKIAEEESCRQHVKEILSNNGNIDAVWRFLATLDSDCPREPALARIYWLQKFLRRHELIGEVLAAERYQPHNDTRFYCEAL